MLIGILVILEDDSEVFLFFEVMEKNLILSSESMDDEECHLTWFLENALHAIDKAYMADSEISSYEEVILRLRPYFLCRENIKVMSTNKGERRILLSGEDILYSFITLVYFNKEIEE